MNTFVENIGNQMTRTQNGMKARESTNSNLVDLFFNIGAMRGQNPVPAFIKAYNENKELALRILFWVRDVRSGAGERKIFRDIMQYLEKNDKDACIEIIRSGIVEKMGRWDDLLIFTEEDVVYEAMSVYSSALLEDSNGLAAKWAPRKGKIANALRSFMSLTPKKYRKLIVELTKVVETQMCAKDWKNIDFGKVPSLASARYRKAFGKNAPTEYQKYVDGLSTGETKVNTGAVYPYDVVKNVNSYGLTQKDIEFINAQWDALPNYMDDQSVLPLVDVSGSMCCSAGGNANLSCMDVAISLGLYTSEKNKGAFKDTFITFSSNPQLISLKGKITDRYNTMKRSDWGMSTNLHAAFEKILSHAVRFNVSQEDMPKTLLILSDMQFNSCAKFDDTAMEMIERKYREVGYEVPKIVFWNLNSYDNVPVKFDKNGTALISGFSPSIMKSVLAAKEYNPYSIMLETIMDGRYDMSNVSVENNG